MEYSLLFVMGVPTAVTGLAFWCVQRAITKMDKRRIKREEAYHKYQELILEGVNISLFVGEVTAKAIKTGSCNGDVEEALQLVRESRKKQKAFLNDSTIHQIFS